jgi:hypothetical protein
VLLARSAEKILRRRCLHAIMQMFFANRKLACSPIIAALSLPVQPRYGIVLKTAGLGNSFAVVARRTQSAIPCGLLPPSQGTELLIVCGARSCPSRPGVKSVPLLKQCQRTIPVPISVKLLVF